MKVNVNNEKEKNDEEIVVSFLFDDGYDWYESQGFDSWLPLATYSLPLKFSLSLSEELKVI